MFALRDAESLIIEIRLWLLWLYPPICSLELSGFIESRRSDPTIRCTAFWLLFIVICRSLSWKLNLLFTPLGVYVAWFTFCMLSLLWALRKLFWPPPNRSWVGLIWEILSDPLFPPKLGLADLFFCSLVLYYQIRLSYSRFSFLLIRSSLSLSSTGGGESSLAKTSCLISNERLWRSAILSYFFIISKPMMLAMISVMSY